MGGCRDAGRERWRDGDVSGGEEESEGDGEKV